MDDALEDYVVLVAPHYTADRAYSPLVQHAGATTANFHSNPQGE